MAYISVRIKDREYSHRFQELKYKTVGNTLSDRLLYLIKASTIFLIFNLKQLIYASQ